MKQITFSNVVAIIAILVCIYSFVGEKPNSSNIEEKEYCILRSCARCRMHDLAYSNGKYESPNLSDYFKNNNDPHFLKITSQTINKLCGEGWVLKNYSMASDLPGTIIEQYVFERDKQ